MSLKLSSQLAEVTVVPEKGADILSFVDRRSGVDVLFKTPWGMRTPGPWARRGTSEERWIEAYAGGWQLLLPNGGAECVERGATWGFHGEAALVPWEVVSATDASAVLETTLFLTPLRLRRHLSLEGRLLRIEETVSNESPEEIEVMWSHHPALGAPFLEGGCVLSAGCTSVLADDRFPGTLLAPGSRHDWPYATTALGERVDLREIPPPGKPRSVLAYLGGFTSGFFAVTNPRLRLGFGLRWPLEMFDKAWLWQEVHSSSGWPWFRRAYVVAVEPASTIPSQGMAVARAKGEKGVFLAPGSSHQVLLEAVLFDGAGEVADIAPGGAVRFA
ncbi:MAG: aldose 1-epimerase [Acidimicrobiales bacterium]